MYLLERSKSPLVTIVATKVCILSTIRLGVLKHWDSPSPVFVIRVGQWMFCNPCQSSRDLTPHQHATNLVEKRKPCQVGFGGHMSTNGNYNGRTCAKCPRILFQNE
jgi:hypothetical protein